MALQKRDRDAPDDKAHPFFTIGHSNRSIEEFIGILHGAQIGIVVDVRRLPGSRTYPHFDSDRLANSLAEAQIGYELISPLGGRRRKVGFVAPETNGAWRNKSFHNYADYALGGDFRAGLRRLIEIGHQRRCAFMCSEAVWWRCHRRIIADHLLGRGLEVFHLMEAGRQEVAVPTSEAVFRDGTVIYPAP